MTHANAGQVALVIALALALLIIRKLPGMVKGLLKMFFKEMIAVYIWRHLTGAHYHGERRTDASWFRHGSTTGRKYDHGSFMDRWEHKPRFRRLLWRWAVTLSVIGIGYGLVRDRAVTVHALESLVVYALVVIGFVIEVKIRLRVHVRQIETPIVKSLAPYLRLSEHAVRRLLHISPENVSDDGEIGYLEIPDEITPGDDQQTGMARIIDAHLPVDSELEFKLQQQPRIAVIMAAQKPPAMVEWDETVEAMEHAAYGDIVIGKDRFKNIFTANFVNLDDPHWAFCVQSKRGKSNFLGLVAVQVLHQDPHSQVIALDPKRSSLIDFLGSPYEGIGLKPLLPGVTMANDPDRPEAMVSAVSKARKILEQRSKEYERDRSKKFPLVVVIIDELNMLRDILEEYWAGVLAENARRDKDMKEDLPRECPVWADIRAILRTGRFVGVHMLAVAQDFRDDAIGGKGTRNYFGLRGLGGFFPNQWKYFVGTTPVPLAQKGVGRWIFTQSEDQDWVQITRADADRAYAWASHGREMHTPEALEALEPSVPDALDPGVAASILEEDTDRQTLPDARVIGLREGARHLGLSFYAFDQARRRHKRDTGSDGLPGEMLVGKQPAWYPDDLTAWNDSRPGNKRRNSGQEADR